MLKYAINGLMHATVVHVNSGNENDHLGNRPKRPHFIQNTNYLPKRPLFFGQNGTFNNYRLMHALKLKLKYALCSLKYFLIIRASEPMANVPRANV
jgi:hypothetical protein